MVDNMITLETLLSFKEGNKQIPLEILAFYNNNKNNKTYKRPRHDKILTGKALSNKLHNNEKEHMNGELRNILNKLNMANLEKSSEEMLKISLTKEIVISFADIFLQKIIREHSFCKTYVIFLSKLNNFSYEDDGKKYTLLQVILNKCQVLFNEYTNKEADMLLFNGLMTFLAEIFRVELLNIKILDFCVNNILDIIIKNPSKSHLFEGVNVVFTLTGKSYSSKSTTINNIFGKLDLLFKDPNIPKKEKFKIDDIISKKNIK